MFGQMVREDVFKLFADNVLLSYCNYKHTLQGLSVSFFLPNLQGFDWGTGCHERNKQKADKRAEQLGVFHVDYP
jgi:hypothetical protein